jgi:hypothetical protein
MEIVYPDTDHQFRYKEETVIPPKQPTFGLNGANRKNRWKTQPYFRQTGKKPA